MTHPFRMAYTQAIFMLRKSVIWVLLLPLSFNGWWMVCDDVPSIATESPDPSAKPQEVADCTKMCPQEKPLTEGSVCLLTADGDNGSIVVIVFGVAVLPVEALVPPPVLVSQFLPPLSDSYLNPSLPQRTPPPRV